MKLDEKRFRELVDLVFARRQVLKEIISSYGKISVLDYAKKELVSEYVCPFPDRYGEFIEVLSLEIARLFGKTIAGKTVKQMKNCFSVSTSDHQGPLTSPFFVNPNLICAEALKESEMGESLIVFPCANVSFHNSSHPCGLLYNFKNGQREMRKISFVPVSKRSTPLYGAIPYTKENYKNATPKDVPSGLKKIIDEIFDKEEIYSQKDFSDQMTVANYYLWKKFFPENEKKHVDLLYIPLENMVVSLIIRHHLGAGTILDNIILNKYGQSVVAEFFDGIYGAFDLNARKGSYLFWGITEGKRYSVPLWIQEGKYLADERGSIKVELTAEAIKDALEKKKIVPGLLLCYLTLACWYGLRCLGGFSQVNYLTEMKAQWDKFLAKVAPVSQIANISTKGLAGDLTVAYIRERASGRFFPATGLDLIYYKNPDTWNILKTLMKKVSVEESIYPLCAEFYSIVYRPVERDEKFSSVTSDDIAEYLDVSGKFRACVEFG